ncbi:MAG: radical SAM protein [Nitrospiraceae bacterium]|nr:MAG: radical SAM protein [Nitrospiraceae bacterium]
MKLRLLLINPWIYDFAAANLWASPLGLLHVAECLSLYDVEFAFIDCTDSVKWKRYGKGKYQREIVEKPDSLKAVPRKFCRYGISIDEFNDALKKALPVDAVLITSIMSWWYPGIRKVIELIRSVSKNTPIILGGIYATLWHSHAAETSGADFIFRGQVSNDLSFAFNTFGFKLKRKREKAVPFYRLGLYDAYPFAPLLTSTGCPFNCDYCGSGQLNSNYVRRTAEGVLHDITEFHCIGVRDFAFYDDALLVCAETHIKLILKEIINRRMDMRFHCPNGLHARHIDDELARLMKESGFRTLRLSLETINAERQKETGGKVCSEDLISAVSSLKRHGFTKEDIGVYLMYGLPGQEFYEVREGVEFLKALDVKINLTEFSPVPGTKCWADLVSGGTIREDLDPLLTNNTVFTSLFSGYDPEELDKIKLHVKEYNLGQGKF